MASILVPNRLRGRAQLPIHFEESTLGVIKSRRVHCHDGTLSETTVGQKSQQVIASGFDSPESYVDYVDYDTPYDYPTPWEGYQIPPRKEIDDIDDIIISE